MTLLRMHFSFSCASLLCIPSLYLVPTLELNRILVITVPDEDGSEEWLQLQEHPSFRVCLASAQTPGGAGAHISSRVALRVYMYDQPDGIL